MLITEELLIPYRKKLDAEIELSQIPSEWFSSTEELFGIDWHADGFDPQSLNVTAVLAFTRWVPPLNAACEWHALWHQCGAYSTHAVKMIATPLKIAPKALPSLNAIARKFYYAQSGHFDRFQLIVSLIVEYVIELNNSDLDCEATWRFLEEAIYPVDATQSNLDRICISPPQLCQITKWGDKVPRYITDPSILLLTENSD